MSYPPPIPPPPPQQYFQMPPPNYANWFIRAGGYLTDYVVAAIPATCGCCIGNLTANDHESWGWRNVHNFNGFGGAVAVVLGLISLAIWAYNRWYLAGTTGQSWGKRLLGTRLIAESDGQPIGPLMAFLRDLAHIVDTIICYVGWLFPLWDNKRQTLADKIMSTVVLKV